MPIYMADKLRKKLNKGCEQIKQIVGSTMGPKGQNVMVDSGHFYSKPIITKDGVTVIRTIYFDNKIENMSLKVIREASEQTLQECGDGTTSTAVLASSIFINGLKYLDKFNPILMKRGMDKFVDAFIKKVDEVKKELKTDEEIRNIAMVSSNHDENITNLITDAIKEVDIDGAILIEKSNIRKDYLEIENGYKIERGMVSQYFINSSTKVVAEYNDAYIALFDFDIDNINDLINILSDVKAQNKPIVLIAHSFSPEVIQLLITNKVKNGLKVIPIEAPGFGDRKSENLMDIAVITNSIIYGLDKDVKEYKLSDLKVVGKVKSTMNETILSKIEFDEEKIFRHIEMLRDKQEQMENEYDKELIEDRIRKLKGKTAIIRIYGETETEYEEKKDRVDDAIGATRSAIEDGIVTGGSVSYIKIAEMVDIEELELDNDDEFQGVYLLAESLKEPLKMIALNAGRNGEYVIEKIIETIDDLEFGYNALEDKFENLVEKGIIDPSKVIKSVVKNAVSAAGMLLTTNALMIQNNE